MQVITAISHTAYFYCTAIYYLIYAINLDSRRIYPCLHLFIAPFILIMFFPFIFNRFNDGLVIALFKTKYHISKGEEVMKRFMEMFEDLMVAVTFAEAGVSVSFLQQKDNLHREWEGQAWDLR